MPGTLTDLAVSMPMNSCFGRLAGKEGRVDMDFRSYWWPELQENRYLKKMDLIMLGNMISMYAYLDTDGNGFFRGQSYKDKLLEGCTVEEAMGDQWLEII